MSGETAAEKRIAMALLDLLNVKPFEKISISEITEKASVSRVSYYRHYSSREDILIKHSVFIVDCIVNDARNREISNAKDFWNRLYKDLGETKIACNMQKAGLEEEFFHIFEEGMSVVFSEIMGLNLADKMNLILIEFIIGGFLSLLRQTILEKHMITDDDIALFLKRMGEYAEFYKQNIRM